MIKEEGINFHQMICLACCNGLDVQAHQLMETDKTEEALANFRYNNYTECLHTSSIVLDKAFLFFFFQPKNVYIFLISL